jgi:hypothetical protein
MEYSQEICSGNLVSAHNRRKLIIVHLRGTDRISTKGHFGKSVQLGQIGNFGKSGQFGKNVQFAKFGNFGKIGSFGKSGNFRKRGHL